MISCPYVHLVCDIMRAFACPYVKYYSVAFLFCRTASTTLLPVLLERSCFLSAMSISLCILTATLSNTSFGVDPCSHFHTAFLFPQILLSTPDGLFISKNLSCVFLMEHKVSNATSKFFSTFNNSTSSGVPLPQNH